MRSPACVRAALAALALGGGCEPPAASPSAANPAGRMYAMSELVGEWRWILRTSEHGTTRVEDEVWQLAPGATPTQLVGRYVRTVEVRAGDRVPFDCNQRPWYRQRAAFEVVVELAPGGFAVRETAYRAEPGPCDHGFRHLGAYAGELEGLRLRLRWPGGQQTLWRVGDLGTELAAAPWAAAPPLEGAWRWDATSYDDDGHVHDETEWWEITRRSAARVDATYRRRVTIRSADGQELACAGAPSWSFEDAYVLDGAREDARDGARWRFTERAADPGEHPCLRVTPRRALDEATAEHLGDHLILEWRGKRRQVLYRPG